MNKLSYTEELNTRFNGSDPHEVLSYFLSKYKDKIIFSSSLGLEDQIITRMIVSIDHNAKIFTLDTGRLFQETYDLIEKTNARFGINIDVVFPDAMEVEKMVQEKGINLFYQSIENRKLCCNIRKIHPIKRVLKGQEVLITGIRNSQSAIRTNNKLVERDENYNLIKINPLISWSEKDVKDYIRKYNIPCNTLHNKGFPSIGCKPCTRAVSDGEDQRAGRWWWENSDHKECGLHNRSK